MNEWMDLYYILQKKNMQMKQIVSIWFYNHFTCSTKKHRRERVFTSIKRNNPETPEPEIEMEIPNSADTLH